MGMNIGARERLTNVRYADDLLTYAHMVDALCYELGRVGLNLNATKTKIFTTLRNGSPLYVDMGGDLVQVLDSGDCHRYLGKRIPGDLSKRGQADVNNRIQSAWAAFHKHRSVLTNKHVTLRSRLKLFASAVTPTIMFGLKSCPCTVAHLKQIHAVQRKMLRAVVGWTRVPGENWADTMRRMRDRVQRALDMSKMQDWSKILVGLKYRLAHVVASCPHSWAHAA